MGIFRTVKPCKYSIECTLFNVIIIIFYPWMISIWRVLQNCIIQYYISRLGRSRYVIRILELVDYTKCTYKITRIML